MDNWNLLASVLTLETRMLYVRETCTIINIIFHSTSQRLVHSTYNCCQRVMVFVEAVDLLVGQVVERRSIVIVVSHLYAAKRACNSRYRQLMSRIYLAVIDRKQTK